jgi:hypothetical protein
MRPSDRLTAREHAKTPGAPSAPGVLRLFGSYSGV